MYASTLTQREFALQEMGVGVSGEQCRLKKNETGVPNRRDAAIKWQENFSQERLHKKEQQRSQENRR